MILNGFLIAFVALNFAFDSANSQFYVDIEHSLPRIGKRMEVNSNDHVELSPSKLSHLLFKNEINENLNKMTVEEGRVFLSNAVQLLKMLSRKYEDKYSSK